MADQMARIRAGPWLMRTDERLCTCHVNSVRLVQRRSAHAFLQLACRRVGARRRLARWSRCGGSLLDGRIHQARGAKRRKLYRYLHSARLLEPALSPSLTGDAVKRTQKRPKSPALGVKVYRRTSKG